MNPHLLAILPLIEKNQQFSDEERKQIENAVKESLEELKAAQAQLETKNRDLEIEAALERVRAQAMSMKKPDELMGVCEMVFAELKALGFTDLRNTEIIINNDFKESVLSYYFSDYGVTGTIEGNKGR